MRNENQEGTVGDHGSDGWVRWTTRDDNNSYLPALHCGAFEIVVGDGTCWGARDDRSGVLLVAPYASDCDGPPDNIVEMSFDWNGDSFLRAVADVLDLDEQHPDLEHPAPHNVLDAARELWTALMFRDAKRCAS